MSLENGAFITLPYFYCPFEMGPGAGKGRADWSYNPQSSECSVPVDRARFTREALS